MDIKVRDKPMYRQVNMSLFFIQLKNVFCFKPLLFVWRFSEWQVKRIKIRAIY